MGNSLSLDDFKSQIIKCDEEILYLIKRRVEVFRRISKFKFKNNILLEKYDDKKNFLFYADKKTEALKLNKKPVIEIFKILEKESNEILEKEFLKLKNRKK